MATSTEPRLVPDRGATFALDAAVAAVAAAAAGAGWVDIGGQPFAPGEPVSVAEELTRFR